VSSSEPRVAPLPEQCWDDASRSALLAAVPAEIADGYLSTDSDSPQIPNAFGTLVHNPAVASTFFAFNRVLLRHGSLPPRWRELVVLRVAWSTGSAYEWAQHVRLARRVGLTERELTAEATLLTATDQLLDRYQIDDDTWSQLAQELDESQLVELPFVVGAFVSVAMALKSLGVALDADLHDVAPPERWRTTPDHCTERGPTQ
jgi:4-carboxymuconolactone decarboxylase